eukprot:TRINITY_DN20805_c0_g1_i3.p1 TRINITY_DN20805_c0_g1~~TRINITY_DN20805_c0_g1_i3.p1  ORF type:complete len:284 (-),score=67.88 TRINITY_DN20805_c0_g1_i3:315-1166(-)
MELLEAEERRLGAQAFGVKERKAVVEWFTQAGAEKSATHMHLDKVKWTKAILQWAVAESGSSPENLGEIAGWLHENRLKQFEERAKLAKAAAESDDSDAEPEYPITASLSHLEAAIARAHAWGKIPLVLSQGQGSVEEYFSFQQCILADCEPYTSEMVIKRTKTEEQVRDEILSKLQHALQSPVGLVHPLHFRLGSSAFDLKSICNKKLHHDLFNPKLWTPDRAYRLGFIDGPWSEKLEKDEALWKRFNVTISSNFSLSDYESYLADRIPRFEQLAVIAVGPA